MISYIRGELADVREDQVVIDVGGVGYGIFMSGSDIARLPSTGQEVKINTYLHVKEDVMQLFGFLTRDGLEVFRLIIGVSGIGPKGGLNILNQMTPNDLRFAVLAGDVKAISKAQGIGKKTAEKLILELKDKLELTELVEMSRRERRFCRSRREPERFREKQWKLWWHLDMEVLRHSRQSEASKSTETVRWRRCLKRHSARCRCFSGTALKIVTGTW